MALIETLKDDFEFGGIDSGKWTATNGQVVVGTDLNLKLSSTAGGNYVSLDSTTTYSLIASSIFIQVTDVGDQSITSWEVYPLYLVADSNNKVFIRITGNTIQAQKVVAGVTTDVGSPVTYNSATTKWFRIRESGGTTFFDYASDPSGTWTNFASVANPITLTALTAEVLIGTWQAESTTTAKLDNLNVIPNSLQFNWKGYTWNKRIHQSNVAGQVWSSSNISAPDPSGYLTLQLTNAGSAPIGAEIFSDQRGFGYGTYTVVVGTRLDNIGDPVSFGGLFTFDFTDSPAYREIDMNETRDYNSEPNKQILKNHVYNNGGSRAFITNNMDYPSDVVQTHVMRWVSDRITFDSYIGAGTSGSNYFHTEHATNLPTPGLERVHFNVFVDPTIAGYATATPLDVVIRDFNFTPLTSTVHRNQSKIEALSRKTGNSSYRLSEQMRILYGGRGTTADELVYLNGKNNDSSLVNRKNSDAWTKFASSNGAVGSRADQLERDFYNTGDYP